MNTRTAILSILLAASLLFNVVAFARLSDDEPAKAPAPEPRASRPAERPEEPAPLPAAASAAPALLKDVGAPAVPAPVKTKASAVLAAAQADPKVREVLLAGEQFGAFWRDLDKVFKARGRLEETKYAGAVTSATADFLELGEPGRAQFEEAAKAAAARYGEARKEHDAAKQTLPPKDKSNASAYAAYQQQKEVVDARFQAQVKGAIDTLKPYLSPSDARHQEFLASAEKWLKNLAPR